MAALYTTKQLVPALAVLGSIISLCLGASFAKQLFSSLGAEGTTTLRVVFAACMLMIVWRPWRTPLSLAEKKAIFLYGAILGLMNLCFYMSIRNIPLGIAIAI